jgi:predicted phage terminase large subunit-like protein
MIIIDDPLNPKQAASEVETQNANQWMDVTLSTRKVDKAVTPTILVMQRLSENDCTGNWLSKKGKAIRHICLPGELSDNVSPVEVREKYVDGLLDPIRLNKSVLDEMALTLGSYGFAGQIQQRPAPENGAIWQKQWFVVVPDSEMPLPNKMTAYASDWDLAYTENEMNAANAYVTSGMYQSRMYIDFIGFEWLEFPDLIPFMKQQPSPHYIEGKASGKSSKQTLVRQGIPAIEIKVDGGDKVARTKMVTPYAESGMICVRKSQIDKLLNDDRQGILKFPNSKFKDLNDALTQAIARHFQKNKLKPTKLHF